MDGKASVDNAATTIAPLKPGQGLVNGLVYEIHPEVYSRIVGYLRPVRDWNVAKKQEFRDRQTYQVTDANGHVLR